MGIVTQPTSNNPYGGFGPSGGTIGGAFLNAMLANQKTPPGLGSLVQAAMVNPTYMSPSWNQPVSSLPATSSNAAAAPAQNTVSTPAPGSAATPVGVATAKAKGVTGGGTSSTPGVAGPQGLITGQTTEKQTLLG